MVARISVDDLKKVLEVPPDVADDSLQSFIDIADMVVSEELASKGLSDARLVNIEKLLAAHYALLLTERGGLTSSRVGIGSQDTYNALQFMQQTSFMATRYGQQAVALDTTGTLLSMSVQKKKALFRSITTTWTDDDSVSSSVGGTPWLAL